MARATIVVAVAFLIVGFAQPLFAQNAAAIEQGKKVYASNRCSICHSIDGQGNKKGPLEGVGKKLSADEIRMWMSDAEGMTAKTKAARKPPMKSYPTMAKADLDALVSYMQSLK
jgi:mono/diheme cytochrome c family protein